jgi:hypothetical protein
MWLSMPKLGIFTTKKKHWYKLETTQIWWVEVGGRPEEATPRPTRK